MHKKINILSMCVCMLSMVALIGYKVYEKITTDQTIPVIQMDQEEIEISVKDDVEALKKGMTVYDEKDGDITESLTIDNITEFLEDGTRQIEYVAFDGDDHIARATRRIIYSDYTTPRFSITEPLRFSVSNQDVGILNLVHASDCIDGDITNQVSFTEDSQVNVSFAADYPVTLTVTNSAGDTQELPVTVVIYDPSEERYCPLIMLSEYLVYTRTGEKIKAADYLSEIVYNNTTYTVVEENGDFGLPYQYGEDGSVLSPTYTVNRRDFRIFEKVNYDVPGVYEIEYTLDDPNGYRGRTILTVVVEGE